MSFTDGIDIFDESVRRRKRSAIPSFSGDLDIDKLSRGIPFGTSQDVNQQTKRNLTSPFTTRSENAGQTNGRTKKKSNKRDTGRKNLIKENRRLRRGGQPNNIFETDTNVINDDSFRSLGV